MRPEQQKQKQEQKQKQNGQHLSMRWEVYFCERHMIGDCHPAQFQAKCVSKGLLLPTQSRQAPFTCQQGLKTAVSIKQLSLLAVVGEAGVGVTVEQGVQICLEVASVSQASSWICTCLQCCSVPSTAAV